MDYAVPRAVQQTQWTLAEVSMNLNGHLINYRSVSNQSFPLISALS